MVEKAILDIFSTQRLGGEPVPDDLKILLEHAEELKQHCPYWLNLKKDWTPNLFNSDGAEANRSNPGRNAQIRAWEDAYRQFAFVAEGDRGALMGYWRGPNARNIANSPLIIVDHEGSNWFCLGTTLAEAMLGESCTDQQFIQMRDWLQSIGITVQAESQDDLKEPRDEILPVTLFHKLHEQYRKAAGLS